jgi:hypothetical protein
LRRDHPHSADKWVAHWYWPRSKGVLLQTRRAFQHYYLWVDLEEGHTEDVTRLFLHAPDTVLWDAEHPDVLWNVHGSAVDRIDLDAESVSPNWLQGLRSLVPYRGHVYVLTEDYQAYRVNSGDRNDRAVLPLGPWIQALKETSGFLQWWVLPDRTYLFLSNQGNLIASWEPFELTQERVLEVLPHPEGASLLVRARNELGVIALETEAYPAGVAPRVRWLLQHPAPLVKAQWVHGGTYLLFQEASAVYLVQLWKQAAPDVVKLVDTARGSAAVWLDGRLYFLDPQGSLVSREVFPTKSWGLSEAIAASRGGGMHAP